MYMYNLDFIDLELITKPYSASRACFSLFEDKTLLNLRHINNYK